MPNRPLRIFHVDDDPFFLTLVRLMLKVPGGAIFRSCWQSEKALHAMRSFIPDVILLDYRMPRLSGPELLELIRETRGLSDIPVVFLTGDATPELTTQLKSIGASQVFSKTDEPNVMLAKLSECLQQVGSVAVEPPPAGAMNTAG